MEQTLPGHYVHLTKQVQLACIHMLGTYSVGILYWHDSAASRKSLKGNASRTRGRSPSGLHALVIPQQLLDPYHKMEQNGTVFLGKSLKYSPVRWPTVEKALFSSPCYTSRLLDQFPDSSAPRFLRCWAQGCIKPYFLASVAATVHRTTLGATRQGVNRARV